MSIVRDTIEAHEPMIEAAIQGLIVKYGKEAAMLVIHKIQANHIRH